MSIDNVTSNTIKYQFKINESVCLDTFYNLGKYCCKAYKKNLKKPKG